MRRRSEGKRRLPQRDPRIDGPAGEAVQVAQQRQQTELAQRAQRTAFFDAQHRMLAAHLQVQPHVVGQQGVVAAPALQRHAQRRRGDRGAAQHAVAAPGQPPREPAQGLVVERLHRRAAEGLELRRGDPRRRVGPLLRRDPCLSQCGRGVLAVAGVGRADRLHEGHRRGRCRSGRQGRRGRGGQERAGQGWHDLQPLWRQLRAAPA